MYLASEAGYAQQRPRSTRVHRRLPRATPLHLNPRFLHVNRWTKWAPHSVVRLAVKASLAKALCERSLAKRLSVVAPEFRVHVNHYQKDTIPGYTAELGYQVGQLRAQ